MSYVGPDFVNGGPPAVNATNLNGMVNELEKLDPYADEVDNARTGAGGTTYASLGEAVRTQVNDLQDEISEIKVLETSSVPITAATFLYATSDVVETYGNDSVEFTFTETANPWVYYRINNLIVGQPYDFYFTLETGNLSALVNQSMGVLNGTSWSSIATTRKKIGNVYHLSFIATKTSQDVRFALVYNSKDVILKYFKIDKLFETSKVLSDIERIESDVDSIKEDINLIDEELIDGNRRFEMVNGSFTLNPLRLTSNSKRVRESNWIMVKEGDIITIENGTLYQHVVGIWRGTLQNPTNIRNDNTFNVNDEKIRIENDGFAIVVFSNKNNPNLDIDVSDFDGNVVVSDYAYNEVVKEDTYVRTITARNLIRNVIPRDVTTSAGIRYIISENGTVTIKAGTCSSNLAIDVQTFRPLFNGDYWVSGVPVLPAALTNKVVGYMQNPSTNLPKDNGNGVTNTLSTEYKYNYRIIVYSGYTNEEDIVITPSLVYESAFDKTLKVPNMGADSKAVGDKCDYLLELIQEIAQYVGGDVNPIQLSFLGNNSLGDCNLLQYTDGTVVMIDCMTSSQYSKLKADLLARQISHIDIFILSHYHEDHAGNMINMLNDGYLDSDTVFYLPPDLDTTYDHAPYPDNQHDWGIICQRYLDIKAALAEANCTVIHPTEGQEVSVCGSTIKFVNCDHSYLYGVSSNYNDWSLCNYLFNGDMSVFYSGDAGKISQAHMADNIYKANIYKSDHHGWANGINAIDISYMNHLVPDVVISENSPVHERQGYLDSPSSPIQAYCECNGVPHYMTVKNNNEINIHLDKFNWKFKDKYVRYIEGTNHKNWAWVDNDKVFVGKISTDENGNVIVSNN